jgi:hypothetical protein
MSLGWLLKGNVLVIRTPPQKVFLALVYFNAGDHQIGIIRNIGSLLVL